MLSTSRKEKKLLLENVFSNNLSMKFLILILLFFYCFDFSKKNNEEKINTEINKKNVYIPREKYIQAELENEQKMPHLEVINKKRVFEKRVPLAKAITCQPHFRDRELMAFMTFLDKNNTFFETGSGCSTIIAKYYTKKVYAVEGSKIWYNKLINDGLKDNIIFKDLKPDDPTWSYPGKKTNIKHWKNYFQSYKKEYDADVILIDGRFKIATAFDIFNKIREDSIVLIHEYCPRPLYFVIEDYYQYIYHWDTLAAFVKKKDIKEIPLDIQKRYWNESL